MNTILPLSLLLATQLITVFGTGRFMWLVYLYSGCQDQENKTDFSRRSIALKKYHLSSKEPAYFLKITDYDVCYDQHQLILAVTEILLNLKFRNVAIDPKFSMETNIGSIAAYIPTSMFKLLQELMVFTNIPIVAQSGEINLSDFHPVNNRIVSFRKMFLDIDQCITDYKWQALNVLLLKPLYDKAVNINSFLYDHILTGLRRRQNQCFKAAKINFYDIEAVDSMTMNNFLQLVENSNMERQAFIVASDESAYNSFIRQIIKNHNVNNYYFLHFGYNMNYWKYPLPVNSTFLEVGNHIGYKSGDVYLHLNTEVRDFNEARNLIFHRAKAALFSLLYGRFYQRIDMLFSSLLADPMVISRRYHYKGFSDITKSFFDEKEFKKRSETVCPNVICQPGFQREFGILQNHSPFWETEIAFQCIRCPVNHYKATFGDDKCKPCRDYFVTNEQRSECVDPFQSAFITIYSLEGVLCMVEFSISILMTISIVSVFAWKRDTPIVRSSDTMFTFFHLLLILLTNVFLPLTYYGQPNTTKCMARICIVAVLYNGNLSVILVKSNKLVQVFKSKTRISGKEMTRTKITQWFIIIINMLVGLSIILILLQNEPIRVGHSLDFNLKIRSEFCSSQGHNNIVNILSLLIQIGCMGQAFRCRRLPAHLNEAMSILYLSFFTIMSSIILFPIYYFQKNEIHASLVHLVVFQCNISITLLLLYGKKTYIMLFQPHLNTKLYFRQQQMNAIEMKAKTKI